MLRRARQLAIGFNKQVDADTMRAATLDGSIEQLLTWHTVRVGDFFYVPANTVHAIGAGISLIEVQQNSDITYRLYDYGRPRELHLDDGIAVASGTVYDVARWNRHVDDRKGATLVEGPYFRLDLLAGGVDPAVPALYGKSPLLVVPLKGAITIGKMPYRWASAD